MNQQIQHSSVLSIWADDTISLLAATTSSLLYGENLQRQKPMMLFPFTAEVLKRVLSYSLWAWMLLIIHHR
jgi:hypothetical protein